jgi:pyruvate ferredoxin oxidoreductase delta subunit
MADKLNPGAVADRPGSSRQNKTGSWRTFKPIVTDKCIACGICVQYCPEACIEVRPVKGSKARSGKKAVIDYEFCKGCLICLGECPSKAITSEREEK